ncbi:beta-eliminating lyase-related protein [Isoptericola sp. b441]|uniref:Beta-eliminating lyase-related protein n=1 Tax=Actinotalea lenta TaxID=3064654 RepID=A0ABT9D9Z4_9CELL|nr:MULTISPECIES: beta-eliminating lyase-related protein [unclassified Isoptericola]MDO8107729.1 beta-eliminating lyase-related protein [Isoptericola sp. b441]MDO8120600.1 beta-eliminating lyase-related protein [Isoptericola sp. b490]
MMTLHDPARRTFASDNYAGAHAEVLAAVADASGGHETSYGADAYTTRLTQVLGEHFGRQVEVFPVFTGTGANVVGLSAMLPAWGAVVCAASAHVHTDEGGAPEKVAGIKLLPVPTPDGRLTPELLATEAWGYGFEHRAQPLVVSLTQTTELGTCYTPEQIAALADAAHARGMRVHVDGARLANAAATLDLPLRAFTSDVGVDVVSLGGTKNGALAAEAVVVLDPAAADGLAYLRKTQMQLASKMRFVSAQLLALFDGDLWLRSAQHANAMARRLLAGVRDLPGVQVTRPVESNAVFAILARDVADRIREDFWFYDWDEATGEVRWMCAFDTTPADVDAFVAAVAKAAG